MDLSRIAYEAYVTTSGKTLPSYDELPDEERAAWESAVMAVKRELNDEKER